MLATTRRQPLQLSACRGLGIQYPRRTFRAAKLKVRGLIVLAPILAEAAAPEAAIAVPRLMLPSTFSRISVSTNPVASLPINRGLKINESALRPRRFRYLDASRLTAVLTSR